MTPPFSVKRQNMEGEEAKDRGRDRGRDRVGFRDGDGVGFRGGDGVRDGAMDADADADAAAVGFGRIHLCRGTCAPLLSMY